LKIDPSPNYRIVPGKFPNVKFYGFREPSFLKNKEKPIYRKFLKRASKRICKPIIELTQNSSLPEEKFEISHKIKNDKFVQKSNQNNFSNQNSKK
jgi:hypothetical protein